jgi:hypothetical protein
MVKAGTTFSGALDPRYLGWEQVFGDGEREHAGKKATHHAGSSALARL